MNAIIKEVTLVRDEGQKEYAHDEKDVFANFNRVANLLEEDRKKVLMTYMLKHIDGIAAYVKGHKSQREDVTGRITDCMVYLMLLWGMIEEEDGIVSRKKDDSSQDFPMKTLAYLWVGDAVHLTGYTLKVICKKCARREVGSKSLKKWALLNDNPITLPEELGIC